MDFGPELPLTPHPRDFINCSHPALMQLAPRKERRTPDPHPVCRNPYYTYIKPLRYLSLHCLDALLPGISHRILAVQTSCFYLSSTGDPRPAGGDTGQWEWVMDFRTTALLRLVGHNFSAFQGRTRIARTPEGTSNISRGSAGLWIHLSLKC